MKKFEITKTEDKNYNIYTIKNEHMLTAKSIGVMLLSWVISMSIMVLLLFLLTSYGGDSLTENKPRYLNTIFIIIFIIVIPLGIETAWANKKTKGLTLERLIARVKKKKVITEIKPRSDINMIDVETVSIVKISK